jgi:hypothetical protein
VWKLLHPRQIKDDKLRDKIPSAQISRIREFLKFKTSVGWSFDFVRCNLEFRVLEQFQNQSTNNTKFYFKLKIKIKSE